MFLRAGGPVAPRIGSRGLFHDSRLPAVTGRAALPLQFDDAHAPATFVRGLRPALRDDGTCRRAGSTRAGRVRAAVADRSAAGAGTGTVAVPDDGTGTASARADHAAAARASAGCASRAGAPSHDGQEV